MLLTKPVGADAFKPMDEDRSVIEYARAGEIVGSIEV
jgi:hypothetical protein